MSSADDIAVAVFASGNASGKLQVALVNEVLAAGDHLLQFRPARVLWRAAAGPVKG
ncbi:hypothetical protein [Bosea sp. UNC402CLCol]|uniref:hypothetical protein n=1 Tax=Bosea sp. UNC402CLCol TaxID=1510531 RepID=UPI0012E01944|nr:hypothetical protein [Bosea sp. UNC402CLCol]